MTLTELLETVRRVEVRTNRLVNDMMVGAYLSHFKWRGMDFEYFKPPEIERFGNCGEFATIKALAGLPIPFFKSIAFDGIRIWASPFDLR
jgi:hypothetical protein